MALKFKVESHKLIFKKPAKTSRNVFEEKLHWIIKIWKTSQPGIIGTGEAAPIEFLSPDFSISLDSIISKKIDLLNKGVRFEDLELDEFPSVKFAIDCALRDLNNGGNQVYFESDYLKGKALPINGLVWMNDLDEMYNEAIDKAMLGFQCIKFKIGSHDFDLECRLIEKFRQSLLGKKCIIRLDANGAFYEDEALEKLKELSRFSIHSVEQPIKPGILDSMAKICKDSLIPIALDEELISVKFENQFNLLKTIQPQFLILKPTLLGGFYQCDNWILLANKLNIGWWATSALESNIGLNAIAQWVGKFNVSLPQGLGTGLLYKNNFNSKSIIVDGNLFYVA